VVLSVAIAVLIGAYGLFGFSTGDFAAGREVEAKVVAAQPCDQGAMETVTIPVDGRERQATLDGCGHQQDEPVRVNIPADAATANDLVVRAADAYTGEGDNGRRLGLFLLALAGVASGGYGLLYFRGPRGTPLPLGSFTPPDVTQLAKRIRTRRRG
jgi:hypothetical protein